MARETLTPAARAKVRTVMREFKAGTLHSGKPGPGKGKKVRSRKQAIAIALSEGRRVMGFGRRPT